MKEIKINIGEIYEKSNKNNYVKTKEEVLTLLNEYKGILTKPIIDYLNSLIELEFSVIKNYISETDRKSLANLEIYKDIAIYNIYNRCKNLFTSQDDKFEICDNLHNECATLNVSTKLNDREVELFNFNLERTYPTTFEIPKGFKTMNIGKISLFKTLESSKELREAELDNVMRILEKLYDEKNPYPSRHSIIPQEELFGGPGTYWSYLHEEKIEAYEERFKKLDKKNGLSDEDKKEIEITNKTHDLLLDEFGLTNEDFEDKSSNLVTSHKKIIKRMPNLTIVDHTKYI